MKYLIITNHSYMFWQFRRELTEALLSDGEVVLSTPFTGHENDLKQMGCRCVETAVDRRGINPLTDIRLFFFYLKLIGTEKPDAVITYSIKPNIYAGYACRIKKVPYFVNVQGLGTAFERKTMAAFVSIMYRVALRKVKSVFFENSGNRDEFLKRKIIGEQKTCLLSGAGVNTDYYSFKPFPDESKTVKFLYLGRIMKEKGIDELFETARRIKSEYASGVEFHLVGFFEDEYKDTVEKLAAEGIIVFHGFQSEPRPFYEQAGCVILPSYHEGMSNVLLEAAATGRVLITTDIPGCREAVEDGVTGYLCRVSDSESLYSAVKKYMETPSAAHARMGDLGRQRIEADFSKKDVVAKTTGVIYGALRETEGGNRNG